jgi:hypothetical protein
MTFMTFPLSNACKGPAKGPAPLGTEGNEAWKAKFFSSLAPAGGGCTARK